MGAASELRQAVERRGKVVEDLLKAVEDGDGKLEGLVKDFFGASKVPDEDVAALDAALETFFEGAGGDKPRDVPRLLRIFCRAFRPIYITDSFSIEDSKQLRKMEVGEIFEVEEGPKKESAMGVERVRGRAVKDGTSGWVTVAPNMAKAPPFLAHGGTALRASKAVALQAKASGKDGDARSLKPGEAVQLLSWQPGDEGAAAQLKVQAVEDGVIGWAALSDFEVTVAARSL